MLEEDTSADEQSVLLFGRAELTRADGTHLEAGQRQPLFHVEHAVSGTEAQPLNRWRIVHLTPEPDEAPACAHRWRAGTGAESLGTGPTRPSGWPGPSETRSL
ncbi:MAG: hypothetical protein AAF682_14990 [Planctomycetota bacterium]